MNDTLKLDLLLNPYYNIQIQIIYSKTDIFGRLALIGSVFFCSVVVLFFKYRNLLVFILNIKKH